MMQLIIGVSHVNHIMSHSSSRFIISIMLRLKAGLNGHKSYFTIYDGSFGMTGKLARNHASQCSHVSLTLRSISIM